MNRKTGGLINTPRAQTIAQWFGIDEPSPAATQPALNIPDLDFNPTSITLITGASGSGKSSLLRAIRRKHRDLNWINLHDIQLPNRMVCDSFGDDDLEKVLQLLGRLGLGEVWTYLRKPFQLSQGQRWRLRWALALSRAEYHPRAVIAADEFCALLDPVTARIVSRCLRRTIDQIQSPALILATSREDLAPALKPNTILHCDFGSITLSRGDPGKLGKIK